MKTIPLSNFDQLFEDWFLQELNSFHPSVAIHIETSHLTSFLYEMQRRAEMG